MPTPRSQHNPSTGGLQETRPQHTSPSSVCTGTRSFNSSPTLIATVSPFAVQVGALSHHMQCVEELSHEEKLNLLLQRTQLKRHPTRGVVMMRSGIWKTHIDQ